MKIASEVFGSAKTGAAIAALVIAAATAFSCPGAALAQDCCTITGTVSSGGLPAASASVYFFLGGAHVTTSWADGDGRYEALLSEPGDYEVIVGYKGAGYDFSLTMPAEGSAVFDMDVTPNLTGTVTSGGLPAASAPVYFYLEGEHVTTSWTDGDGRYEALLSEPGDYEVIVGYQGAGYDFSLTMPAEGSVVVDMDVAANRTGTVTSGGLPAASARIHFLLGGEQVTVSYADGDGRYEALLSEPGDYEVIVGYKGAGYDFSLTMPAEGSAVFDMDVTPNLTGTVSSGGLPAASAPVHFYLGGEHVTTSWTDGDGRYEALLPEPGDYEVIVGYKGAGYDFSLTMPAEGSVVFDMSLAPNLTGTVSSGGLPAANTPVYFYLGGEHVTTSWTDGDGRYEALLSEPGDYEVVMSYAGESTRLWVTMAAGQTLIVDFPPNTPSGADVVVEPDEDTTLTFEEITGDGTTTVEETTGGQPPPAGFKLLKDYYEMTTTAQYSGPIEISIAYDDTGLGNRERGLKLMHLEGGEWVNVTTYLDMDNNVIYGEVSHLSQFAIMERDAIQAAVDIDPDTLNLNSQGRWVTCTITLAEGYDAAGIEPGTVLLEGEIGASRWDYEDGVLTVKFERAALADMLQAGDSVELTVTGDITGGPAFEGSDIIRVIAKGGGRK
ncbi:MAG: carboxypeptidase-like regulatory domain-containing protein [Elusimicrobiota bacterium]